jgi:hypothetical protein
MSAEALRALEWLPWIAGGWVLLWTVDCVVTHVRWPNGPGCENGVTGTELANEGEATRDVLGDLLGGLDAIQGVLVEIRDAPYLEAQEQRANAAAAEARDARSFRVSG